MSQIPFVIIFTSHGEKIINKIHMDVSADHTVEVSDTFFASWDHMVQRCEKSRETRITVTQNDNFIVRLSLDLVAEDVPEIIQQASELNPFTLIKDEKKKRA